MRAKRETVIIEDSRFFDHVGPDGHPERPERLAAVHAAIEQFEKPLTRLAPRAATIDEILRVHDRAHVDGIEAAVRQAPARLDADTFVSAASLDVARLAAGASIDLALRVASGEAATGLAAVRPPGHHAETDRPMGFCLFNNVAIAARALQQEAGVDRILILDWDVHHGNGTQHFFEADASVLYASSHQYPYYPGTGAIGESGVGPGEGFTLNMPLPAGCGDAEYVGLMQQILAPAAVAFRPQVMLISCGFDAHRDDPLAAMNVSADGFRAMAAIARALADDLCEGRIAFILEGGYALSGLREGVGAVLDAIVGEHPTSMPADPSNRTPVPPDTALARLIDGVADAHGPGFSRLRTS